MRYLMFRLFVVASLALTPVLPASEDRFVDDPPVPQSPDWCEPAPPPAPGPALSEGRPSYTFGAMASATRQPQGALSGRVIYMNAGHGWTYDADFTPPWRLLRGNLNDMNEDYGNVDQMNFFGMYCFNAGAVVVPFRPLGQQTNEVVLDNDSSGVVFAGSWANSSSTKFYGSSGDVPYRYASLADAESATATYTPNIPVAGHYPVYTWALHGSDRCDQLYRIKHTGGESQVRIPHYLVGAGWVYLGEYYFNAGSNPASGSVVISNLRGSATGSVIIADAIRFGNGMGATDTGGGGSGYPREDESNRYWIRSSLGQGQSSSLYDGTGDDESDSWSAPPKMTAEMNREASGDLFKRAHIGFHSNAGGGRGAVGLITGTPTPYQSQLALLTGKEVNEDMAALGAPPLEVAWTTRTTHTYSGSYSEITGTLFNNEMAATIVEVAFHDSVDDAKIMRDSKGRAAIARSVLHGLVRFMNTYDTNSPAPLAFLPEPPVNPRAISSGGGNITLTWAAPTSSGGSQSPTNYVIYRSADGYGFGNPVSVGNVTTYTVTNLPANTDHYFRIAAANAGGESMPSETVGCRVSSTNGPVVLVVNAYDRLDRTSNLRQDTTRQGWVAPDSTGAIERVWPRRVNSFDYVAQHGKAISAHGMAFDSCQNEAVANGQVVLANYAVVIWACGNDSIAQETISATEQSRLATYLLAGGAVFVSGSDLVTDLGGPAASTADRNFLQNYLHATFVSSNSASYTATAHASGVFAGNANAIVDDGSRGIYWSQMPDVMQPAGAGAVAAVSYSGVSSGYAGIQYDGSAGGGRVVLFGFPFETMTAGATRSAYMADTLTFLLSGIPTNQPPQIVADPASTRVLQGGTVVLTAAASGTPALNYQWRFNGTPIAGETRTSYTKSNFQPVHSGYYDVVVTNTFGADTSLAALVEATVAPLLQTAFVDLFETNSSSRWTVRKSSTDTRVTFNYDYSPYGIPSAPGSTGGSTRGAKFEANMANGVVAALNMSPSSGVFPADCKLTYYLWMNANGQFPAGGTGSTQHGTVGMGTTGTPVQWIGTGSTADGAWFAVDGEGQGAIDFYACNGTTAFYPGSGVYMAGTASDARDNLSAYYTARFPGGQTAPAVQLSDSRQAGSLEAGTIGFAWRQIMLTRQGSTVEWFIDGHKIASVPEASLPGNKFFIGYWDSYASLSDNTNMSFGMIDNVKFEVYVTNVPPYILSQPAGQSVKEGASATFTVQAGGTATLGYQWRFNGTPIPAATSSSFMRNSVQASDAGTYSVLITNMAGTVTSSGANLAVAPLLPLKFDVAEPLPGGQLRLVLSGEPGTYDILSSTNLVHWTLWTNVVLGAQPAEIVGPTTNAVLEFYRAKSTP